MIGNTLPQQEPQPDLPSDATVIDLEARRTQQMTEAQAGAAELDISFLDDPRFNARHSVVPLKFLDGVLAYFAHAGTDISKNDAWPPTAWKYNYKITELFDRIKFPYDDETQQDGIVVNLEKRMERTARALPSKSETPSSWQQKLRVLYRLRIDELESAEPNQSRMRIWVDIIRKLDSQLPDELRKF